MCGKFKNFLIGVIQEGFIYINHVCLNENSYIPAWKVCFMLK